MLPDPSMKILIVDDFATMRTIIRNLLSELGYNHTVEADDGVSALAKLQKQKFDFVLTDWNMPKMQGIDLIRAIKQDKTLCDIPVLLITAEVKREQIIAAAEAGVNGYMIKPFTAMKLNEKICKICDKIQ